MGWPKFPAIAFCLAGTLAGAGAPALAQDGSYSNNPDIARDGFRVDWVPADAILPGETPSEDVGLPFRTDWSISLRGSYQRDTAGDHYQALVVPQGSLTRAFERGAVALEGEAELGRLDDRQLRLDALRASIAGDYRLDRDSVFAGSLSFARSQDSLLNAAADVIETPLVTSGAAQGSLARQFGKLSLTLRGGFGRTVYGPTALDGGVSRDNAYRSLSFLEGGIRAGLEVTPILTVFTDAGLERSLYDGVSPSVGARTDNYDASLRAGISGKWQDRLEAEVSGGLGFVRYDDSTLGQATSTLYDASLTYRPDETIAIRGGFSTSFVPPGDTIAATRLEYAFTADASYQVNAWLALRASAAFSQVRATDGAASDNSYGFGAGADYTLNRHTLLTADYAFAHTEDSPDPARDAHRVTLGVTFKK